MARLAEIEQRIGNMDGLRGIMGAMRSLAGIRMQEAERALAGVRRYAAVMSNAIGSASTLLGETSPAPQPGGSAHRAVILFTAEHGFVGGFNERLLNAAAAEMAAGTVLFLLGSRGAVAALERGWKPAWSEPMAARAAGAPEAARLLSTELYRRLARGKLARVDMIFGRYRQSGAPETVRRSLLPLDPLVFKSAPGNQPPLHNLPPGALVEKLIAEYVFACLTEAIVESIASENAARFIAMEAAHDNVSKKLDQLRQEASQARQSEITTELVDLVTGAAALEGRARSMRHPENIK
jgi:F-type H+-transporting ATPase subunit gamma